MYIRAHLVRQDYELSKAISQLDEQYARAKARGDKELARAYLVGQAGLLRHLSDVNALIALMDGAQ